MKLKPLDPNGDPWNERALTALGAGMITYPPTGIETDIDFENAQYLDALKSAVLPAVKQELATDIDSEAEARRLIYITPGAGQAAVYLAKQAEATAALAETETPASSAYPMLSAEVGITIDPLNKAPATDILGVARAVDKLAKQWVLIAAAIEAARLSAKRAVSEATDIAAAKSAAMVTWPSP